MGGSGEKGSSKYMNFFFNFQVCHNNFLYLKTHPIEDWELQDAQFF